MSLLLCFSGQIGSGKSSVSTAVANALGWRRTGFGDYLRSEIVRSGGDPGDRKSLQDLGQRRIDSDATAFCRDVLTAGGFVPGDNLVIDGIRHIAIFNIIASMSKPSNTRLLFLGADEATRSARVQARPDSDDFSRASTHRVEAELFDELPKTADGIVNADQPLERVVSECLSFVQKWRRDEASQ